MERDAEERMQDGFIKLFDAISSGSFIWQSDGAFVVWMEKIMINECLAQLRKKWVFKIIPKKEAEDMPLQNEALEKFQGADINRIIAMLPDEYRTVFNLYEIEGYHL